MKSNLHRAFAPTILRLHWLALFMAPVMAPSASAEGPQGGVPAPGSGGFQIPPPGKGTPGGFGAPGGIGVPGGVVRPPGSDANVPGAGAGGLQPPPKNDSAKEIAKIIDGKRLSDAGTEEFKKRIADVYGADLTKAKQTLFFAEAAEGGGLKILPVKYSPINGFEPAHLDRPLLLVQYPANAQVPGALDEGGGLALLELRKQNETLRKQLTASENARKAQAAEIQVLEKAIKELSQ